MELTQEYIVRNDCYQANLHVADSRYQQFQERGPQGLLLHSVGCAQPSARVFIKTWNAPDVYVAPHAVLQPDLVYQCLPWNYRGWHAGEPINNTHIGVEMTEPASLKYNSNGTAFTCSDIAGARQFVQKCFNTAVELFARVCVQYDLDPMKDGVILSHKEAALRGLATNHGDPEHLWIGLGMNLNMDRFRSAVKSKKEELMLTETKVQEMINAAVTDLRKALCTKITNVKDSQDSKLAEMHKDIDAVKATAGTRYKYLKEITFPYAKPTIEKLVAKGYLKGKSGQGENMVIDISEDTLRVLVILDRAGAFDNND